MAVVTITIHCKFRIISNLKLYFTSIYNYVGIKSVTNEFNLLPIISVGRSIVL